MKTSKLILSLILFVCLMYTGCKEESNPVHSRETTGNITGKVTLPNGAPAVGAYITTQPPTDTTATDSTGVFTLSRIIPGDYAITVNLKDYLPSTYSASVVAGQTSTKQIELVRQKYTLWLKVYKERGFPVSEWAPFPSAGISMAPQTESGACADGKGGYWIPNMAAGNYVLTVYSYEFGQVDTVIHVPTDTVNLYIKVCLVSGGVFRYLWPHELRRTNVTPPLLQFLTPVYFNYLEHGHDLSDCNFVTGFAVGHQKIHIESPDCYPLDTTIVVTKNTLCPNEGSFIFIVTPSIRYSLFDFPLNIGTSWTYRYSYHYDHFGNMDVENRRGLHRWTITDAVTIPDNTVAGQSIIYTCTVSNEDTVFAEDGTPTPAYSTSSFTFDVCSPQIKTNWHYTLRWFSDSIYYGILLGDLEDSLSLKIGGAVYTKGVGLQSFHAQQLTNQHVFEDLDLIDFVK